MRRSQQVELAIVAALGVATLSFAQDVSANTILQLFEARHGTIERRAPDIFAAGYRQIWTPPPSRADSGDLSVGYDVFDRFDLGSAGRPTLYGTRLGYQRTIQELHRFGMQYYADIVLNHNGFRDTATVNFVQQGGYPGFVLQTATAVDGDFNSRFAAGVQDSRLAGLIDINQSTNFRYVRSPVPGVANNIPAGTIWNIPSEANRALYPDRQGTSRVLFNPSTNTSGIVRYDFNAATPMAGDPVEENALGLLMRNTQWLQQVIGVDGFRIDAQKHIPTWVFNDFFDLAVYRTSTRRDLNGNQPMTFSFGENYDGNPAALTPYIRKDINPADIGRVGGNRDVKDFPLFFAMRDNLTANGLQNDWNRVINSSIDRVDDGFANNGSQGVAFVQSHDDFGPHLSNVAHAFMLMRPGNAIVYMNAREFGENRAFPKDGRGDALGGLYGNAITTLVDLRNRYGRGNFTPRLVEKESLIYERDRSAVVVLSNRVDSGFDQRSIRTGFAPGTWLLELTGNATSTISDPSNDIPDAIQVGANGLVNLRVLRNTAPGTTRFTGNGYLIYGLPTPQGVLSLDNISHSVAGETPTPGTNGTARVSGFDVVTADTFDLRLRLQEVRVLGQFRDVDADGDNALFAINYGANADWSQNDLNGNGSVDYTDGVVYGFEEFRTKKSPLIGGGDGEFRQTIDATRLHEGFNYIEVRAFRRRTDGGPAVYSSFKRSVYVDRFAASSEIVSFDPWDPGNNRNRDLVVRNADLTASNVDVFLNIGADVSDQTILGWVQGSTANAAGAIDRDLYRYGFFNVGSGNHAITVVTREPSGNHRVQRFAGRSIITSLGRGLGDVDFDGAFLPSDITAANTGLEAVLNSRNQRFNPAADFDGDGRVELRDLLNIRELYRANNATAATTFAQLAAQRRVNLNGDTVTDGRDLDLLRSSFGATSPGIDLWRFDLDANGNVGQGDFDMLLFGVYRSRFGDANLDGGVNFADLLNLARNYNGSGGWADGDFNGDGGVNFADLLNLARNYNLAGPGGPFANLNADTDPGFVFAMSFIPEPASLAVVGVAGIALLGRPRRSG